MNRSQIHENHESLKQKMTVLYESGLSFAEIGKIYGITRQRVHQIVRYSLERIRRNHRDYVTPEKQEEFNKKVRDRRKYDPNFREREKKYNRSYYQENREKILAHRKEMYRKSKEKDKAKEMNNNER